MQRSHEHERLNVMGQYVPLKGFKKTLFFLLEAGTPPRGGVLEIGTQNTTVSKKNTGNYESSLGL